LSTDCLMRHKIIPTNQMTPTSYVELYVSFWYTELVFEGTVVLQLHKYEDPNRMEKAFSPGKFDPLGHYLKELAGDWSVCVVLGKSFQKKVSLFHFLQTVKNAEFLMVLLKIVWRRLSVQVNLIPLDTI
jgi:hypothetical protein